MRCFNRCLKLSPKFYSELVAIIFKDDEGKVCEGINFDEKQKNSIMHIFYNLNFCPAEYEGKVNKNALFSWIDEFQDILKNNRQTRLFTYLLGRVLSASPIGEDGYFPIEAVRDAIEYYGDECLQDEYTVSVLNMRGVYSPSGGTEERALAKRYKINADAIRINSPKTADIYDKLTKHYLYEANSEREREEYMGV